MPHNFLRGQFNEERNVFGKNCANFHLFICIISSRSSETHLHKLTIFCEDY